MRGPWSVWLVLVVASSAAFAQESGAARAKTEQQLRSEDLAQVAWGAQRAASGRLLGAAPALGTALRRLVERPDSPERTAAAAHVLDALVQVEAKVPEELLVPWMDLAETRTTVMAAVSRAPADHGRILEHWLADQSHRLSWMLACSLRMQADPRSMVPYLVREVELSLRVDVHEAGVPRIMAGHSITLRETSPTVREGPPGFPPPVRYQWSQRPGAGAVALGKQLPGWCLARVEASDPAFGGQAEQYRMPAQFALDLLTAHVGAQPMRASVAIDHVWRDAATLTAAVRPELDRTRVRWQVVLDSLAAKGLLDCKAVAAAMDRVEIRFEDQRANQLVPLPEIK